MIKNIDLVAVKDPKSPIAEAYRTLRTNIQFSSFDEKIKTIMLTSSGPGEGKSTTASNLAVVMAENGNSVIIIDCDLRKPRLHKVFGLSNIKGLSNLLVDECSFQDATKRIGIPNLDILTSGVRPPNPSELLQSKKMKQLIEILHDKYDVVIMDTPPVIMVTDAQIISQYADGVILVVASKQAEREAAIKAKQLLEKVNAKILGVVLNKVDVSNRKYYGYYYGADGEKKKRK